MSDGLATEVVKDMEVGMAAVKLFSAGTRRY